MSFGVHPFILISAVGAIAALAAIVIASRAKSGLVIAMMLVLALVFIAPAGCVFLAFHPELVDGRFRTYKRFYRDIQVGMTREQVLAAMEQRYPTNGPRKRPTILNDTPEGLGFFMNPETSREPNCEGIFLTLEAGRVTRIEYSAD
ncbi:MAG TPA: hypothetical protein P5205_01565 [Candidatus Paceibacterota bacterium]|nr:hypothetical protein [Verrucomicrobiota bacterium]HSA09034.1 hypothetical protein [Candidatus Paceibacterota bacterium]